MFSMSMIASSTTTPTAMTSPARTICSSSPRTRSTSAAAIRDSGIATRLISAVRHSNRNATRIRTTSRQPISSAR